MRLVERLVLEHRESDEIAVDNGRQLRGKAVDQLAYERGVLLCFIEPGMPVQNTFAEMFQGRPRDECLRFVDLNGDQHTVEILQLDGNRTCSGGVLGHRLYGRSRRVIGWN